MKIKTIKTKLHAEYIVVERLLELMGHLGIIRDDKVLSALFGKMEKYVDSKLPMPEVDGDVVDMYFVVEQCV